MSPFAPPSRRPTAALVPLANRATYDPLLSDPAVQCDRERPTPSQGVASAIVLLAGVSAALQVGKVTAMLPSLATSFGMDLMAFGSFIGIFAICAALGGVPAAGLVRRWGDRRVLLVGQGLLCAGIAAGVFAPNFPWLFAARVIEGLAFLMISVAGPALLGRINPPERQGLVLAIWSCYMPVGIGLGLLTFPLLDTWRAVWLANLAIVAVILVAALAWTGRRPKDAPVSVEEMGEMQWAASGASASTYGIFLQPQALILALVFCLYNVVFYAVVSFLPVLLGQRLHLAPNLAAMLSATTPLTNVAGNLLAGVALATGSISRRALLLGGLGGMATSAITLIATDLQFPVALLLCATVGVAAGLVPATLFASMSVTAQPVQLVPAGFGLLVQGANLGMVLGPIAIGLAVTPENWSGGALVIAASALAGLGLVTMLRRWEG